MLRIARSEVHEEMHEFAANYKVQPHKKTMTHCQALKFGMTKYRKNLKISVFVCFRRYLVAFGFVVFRLQEYLVFFDLLIMVFKVFEKIWYLVFYIETDPNNI